MQVHKNEIAKTEQAKAVIKDLFRLYNDAYSISVSAVKRLCAGYDLDNFAGDGCLTHAIHV
jgi:hypothetical protein